MSLSIGFLFPSKDLVNSQPLWNKSLDILIKQDAPLEEIKGFLAAYPKAIDSLYEEKTPLFLAIEKDREDLIDLFLEMNSSDLSKKCCFQYYVGAKYFNTPFYPLQLALLLKKEKIAIKLLQAGANIRTKTAEYGRSCLHIATRCQLHDFIKVLFETCSKTTSILLKEKDKDGCTPLHHAVIKGDLFLVDFFLKNGAEMKIRTNIGSTPLFLAVDFDQTKLVQYFLNYVGKDAGFGINEKNQEGEYTALDFAADKGHVEIAKLLLANGADAFQMTKSKTNALYIAVDKARLPVVEAILQFQEGEKEYPLNEKYTSQHFTPLHAASIHGDLEIVKLLLDYGADLTAKTVLGATPLYYAVQEGKIEVVEYLLKFAKQCGIPIINTICGPENRYPLLLAAQKQNEQLVKVLMEHGADPTIKNTKGQCALEFPIVTIAFSKELNLKLAEFDLLYENLLKEPEVDLFKLLSCLQKMLELYDKIKLSERSSEIISSLNKFKTCVAQLFADTSVLFREIDKKFANFQENKDLEGCVQLKLQLQRLSLVSFISDDKIKIFRESLSSRIAKIESFINSSNQTKELNDQRSDLSSYLTKIQNERNEEDIFSLLALFSVGVGMKSGYSLKPLETYDNYLGCPANEIYQYGLFSGQDLHCLGVDFAIKDLTDLVEDEKDPKHHENLLSALDQELQKKHALLSELSFLDSKKLLMRLEISVKAFVKDKITEKEFLSDCRLFQREYALLILRQFFSQKEKIVVFLKENKVQSLSEIEKLPSVAQLLQLS